jgi:putative membrane protein
LYLKGMCMGAAEVIPGVSGSTAALLTGIYEELIRSLRLINRKRLKLLLEKKFDDFWRSINGTFIVTVLAGILTSLLTITKLALYALKHNPILINAFFFSLILMATPLVMREEIKKWDTNAVIGFVAATLIAYAITYLPPFETPRTVWMIFFVGVLAGTIAFIPGLSFTFILILLGQFGYLTSAFAEFSIIAILIFAVGFLFGLFSFLKFLSHLLIKFRRITIAILTGIMVGCLNKVWPWREVLEFATNRKGEQVPAFDSSILPWNYFETTGKDPQLFQAILMMALGVFIVILIEKIASRRKTTF